MNFFNNYFMYKLLFDDAPARSIRVNGGRASRPSTAHSALHARRRGSSGGVINVEKNRLPSITADVRRDSSLLSPTPLLQHPIKTKLHRQRSGSWAGSSLSSMEGMTTITEADESSLRKPSIIQSILSDELAKNGTDETNESRKLGVGQLTKNDLRSFLLDKESKPKVKEKLSRKRSKTSITHGDFIQLTCTMQPSSGSCPETRSSAVVTELYEDANVTTHKQNEQVVARNESPIEDSSLLTYYLHSYRAASKDFDDELSDVEKDFVVLNLHDYSHKRSSKRRRRLKSAPSRRCVATTRIVDDLINLADSNEDEKNRFDSDVFELKSSHLAQEPAQAFDELMVAQMRLKAHRGHIEAEHRFSTPLPPNKENEGTRRTKSSGSSAKKKSKRANNQIEESLVHKLVAASRNQNCMDLLAKHYLSYNNMFGNTEDLQMHRPKASGSWKSLFLSERRDEKRSPSAPSGRGRFCSPEDSQKISLSPRLSSASQGDGADMLDNNVNIAKDPNGGSRYQCAYPLPSSSGLGGHMPLLQRLKPSNANNYNTQKSCDPEILLTLHFSSTISFVTITVNRAKNLPCIYETFVKVMMFENQRLLGLKQTPVVVESDCPEYKQAYMFGLGRTRVMGICFHVEVWGLNEDEVEIKIGETMVGLQAGGPGALQWMRMIKNAGFPSIMWQKLLLTEEETSD